MEKKFEENLGKIKKEIEKSKELIENNSKEIIKEEILIKCYPEIANFYIKHDIKQTNLEKLDLMCKDIRNNELYILKNDYFHELNLSRNGIIDIQVLEQVKFEKLEKLDFHGIKYQILKN